MTPRNKRSEQHLTVNLTEIERNTDDITLNAVNYLSQCCDLSKQNIKQAMTKGAVWLTRSNNTQRLRRAKKALQHGDILHLYYDEKIITEQPTPATLIADKNAYSVWYKPYGMYCQGSKWADHCTINRWVEHHTGRPSYIVHRLDRAATGLIIIAHEKKCAGALTRLFQQRALKKHYRAIVRGHFPAASKALTVNDPIDGRDALSHIKLLRHFGQAGQSLLDVSIETGRKHQIRRHLAGLGHPIVGERLYAKHQDNADLQLCAWSLEFTCPIDNKPTSFELQEAAIAQIACYRVDG